MDALEVLCQCISPVQNRQEILLIVDSPSFNWDPVIYSSGQHLVSPALWFYLQQKELLPLLNTEQQEYLKLVYDLNLSRNAQIKNQLFLLLPDFNAVGIKPVLLKGIASLLGGLYETSGIRVLGDIDILVPEEKLEIAKNIMLDHGYTYTPFPNQDIDVEHRHLPGFVHKQHPVAIEVHRFPVAEKYFGWVNSTTAQSGSVPLSLEAGVVRLPSPEFRLLHNFCHCQLGDRGFFRACINARQMLEWVKLRDKYEAEFDWVSIQQKVSKNYAVSAWAGYLLAARKYFSQEIIAKTQTPPLAKFFMYRLQCGERHTVCWRLNLIIDRLFYYGERALSILSLNFHRGPRAFFKAFRFLLVRNFSIKNLKEKYKVFRSN